MNTLSPRELARLTGVSADTLRHYERKGLLKPQRTSSGYRRYSSDCVAQVQRIRQALTIGFTLAELAALFSERDRGGVPCRTVRASVASHLDKIETRLRELRRLRRDLQRLLKDWDAQLARTPTGEPAHLLQRLKAIEAKPISHCSGGL